MSETTDEASLARLRGIRAILLDMDGVVYVGQTPLPGVQPFLRYLTESGRKWYFVTNNSTKTPEQFAQKVQSMGIEAGPGQILTSSLATASWMAEHYPERGNVFVLGEHGLRHAVSEAGFTLTEDPFAAQFAVCAVHFSLTYAMLADATLAIRNGATFIGTNIDASFPSERGKVPGSGSVLALLEVASGVKPIVIGKPYPGMFEQAMARLGSDPASTLMVGDRYETDIAGAIELGLTTVGVTTGVTTPAAFAQADPPPDYILSGIPELHRLFVAADSVNG